MEVKKSKPTKIKFVNEYSRGDDIVRRFGIRMENGDVGYNETTSEHCPFDKGVETKYLWEPPQEGEEAGTIEVKQESSQRFYMSNLKGEDYIQVLRKEIKERVKQKLGEAVISVPSFAASYAKDICANKGDFNASEILKSSKDNPGSYDKLYDIVSSKMYDDLRITADVLNEVFKRLDGDE